MTTRGVFLDKHGEVLREVREDNLPGTYHEVPATAEPDSMEWWRAVAQSLAGEVWKAKEARRVPGMRIYWQLRGAHVHCRVFLNGKAGDLVFGEREWPTVREALEQIADVRPEAEDGGF